MSTLSDPRGLLRALLLALALAGPAAAPARAAIPAVASGSVAVAPLADEWSWHGFVKFWKRQVGKTSGVVGVVLLVGFGAVLLILSKTRH